MSCLLKVYSPSYGFAWMKLQFSPLNYYIEVYSTILKVAINFCRPVTTVLAI